MATVVRGPNVNLLDHVEPIKDDPLFNSWRNPVPPEWFSANQKAYTLIDQEALYGSIQFSRYWARTGSDSVSGPSESHTQQLALVRSTVDVVDAPLEFPDADGTGQQSALAAAALGVPPIS